MEHQGSPRHLAAILAADIEGYTRLMSQDEGTTLARLTVYRQFISKLVQEHGGRIFGAFADSAMAEFPSAVQAVRAAVAVQRVLEQQNAPLEEERRMRFRIGINVGEALTEGENLYGDAVNIAARLQEIAAASGICVTSAVLDHVRGKTDVLIESLGERSLKNVAAPVQVYRLNWAANRPEATSFAGAMPALPEKPSIAVLPFVNMSGEQEQEYFSEGITEDIITALSKLRWFFVVARNSSFAYRGKAADVRQVARDLGVRYVLEGSVRKSGDRLRVTGQLIDATTGNHVWAERYDRSVADIFEVQDEITASVVASIEPQLYAAENLRFQTKSPDSLDAWGCVVRAMPYVWTWVAEDNAKGEALLQRAIALDPGYARAHALLAWVYGARAHLGLVEPSMALASALDIGQQALQQDQDDPWAHLAVGYIHMVSRRFKPAIDELSEAVARNPSFAHAFMVMGSTYAYNGMSEEGLRNTATAARLSPRDPIQAANVSTTGTCHFVAERYEEAVDYQRRAVEMRPGFGTAWRSLAATAGLIGDGDLASAALARARALHPGLSLDWVEKYQPLVHRRHREPYIRGLERAGLK